MDSARHRERLVGRLKRLLERVGFPRLQMTLIVSLTAGLGFMASSSLLHLGLEVMWLRYLCAFAVAYLGFLALLWVWLRTRVDDYLDAPGLGDSFSSTSSSTSSGGDALLPGLEAEGFGGGGGGFGGGGAQASFADAAAPSFDTSLDAGGLGDALGDIGDADEAAIPIIALLLVAGCLLASLWIVYSAPALFAEMLVDGTLARGLYRRLRRQDSRIWLQTALRRTALPFVLTAALVSGSGWLLQHYTPGAKSLAEALAHSQRAH